MNISTIYGENVKEIFKGDHNLAAVAGYRYEENQPLKNAIFKGRLFA